MADKVYKVCQKCKEKVNVSKKNRTPEIKYICPYCTHGKKFWRSKDR